MNTGIRTVENCLDRATNQWCRLRLLQHSATLGSIVCLGLLLLAAALLAGWFPTPGTAVATAVTLGGLAALAWLATAFVVLDRRPPRPDLLEPVERGQPRLLDRVTTLVSFEDRRTRPEVAPFYGRIARQTQKILETAPPRVRFPNRRPLVHLAVFLGLALATVLVYRELSPWQRFMAAYRARQEAAAADPGVPPPPPALALDGLTNITEQTRPWGEVRITEPDRDLQVTKVDVVPLRIEAAANEPIQQVGWITALNGQGTQTNDLPPPADPKFASYHPTLYLDELRLADWDLLSYYARAQTRGSNGFASEVYFVEIRPFREDILKLPGGENGRAMRCLEELSALISQQQHIIRQTHQHAQSPPESSKLREQDREKLAAAEAETASASAHLYARMATELENAPIGEALDHLARAEKSLSSAATTLRENALPRAQELERSALADLVASRKVFHKTVTEHPDDFQETSAEPPPSPADSQDQLREMAEFRDEAKAATSLLQQLVPRQQALSRLASTSTNAVVRTNVYPRLAEQEAEIAQSLADFRQKHPRAFQGLEPQADAAAENLQAAQRELANRSPRSPAEAQRATEQLRQLAERQQEKAEGRQLADAYRLRNELERQAEFFGECQNPGPAGAPSGAAVKQSVANTRQALQQLKNLADQSPSGDAFGPGLREALDPLKMTSLAWPLGELENAATPEARQKPAGDAREGISKVVEAFDRSRPSTPELARQAAQRLRQGDPEQGLAQLDSLIRRLESGHPLAPGDQARLAREVLDNLARMNPNQNPNPNQDPNQGPSPNPSPADRPGQPGNQAQTLAELRELLTRTDAPLDARALARLRDALQAQVVESGTDRDARPNGAELTGLEPERVAPAYRGRVERYFRKLSEK